MMKQSILLSVNPSWVGKILSGQKTVEVRKLKPKIKIPFKCYIYETQGKGKVVAEFTCNYIWEFTCKNEEFLVEENSNIINDVLAQSGLNYKEFKEYAKQKTIYGWRISDFVTYKNPRELTSFSRNGAYKLDQPPQSWCYVDEQNV